mgnify:CR=1 FL=1
MSAANVYDKKTIFYHWVSAALIFILWLIGQNIDNFAKGDPRIYVRSIHLTLGVLLAIVFLMRLRWKLTNGVKLPINSGALGKLASGTHHLLYLLLGLTLIVGLAAVWIRGDNIFNIFQVPPFDPSNKPLRKDVVELHELMANSLLILACVHAFIALIHHKVFKDDVLKRMLPNFKD